MGNKGSSPVFPTAKATAEIVRVVNTFGPLLTTAYAHAALRRLQEMHAEESGGGVAGGSVSSAAVDDAACQLRRPPTATEPLERGWAGKLGEVKKNWKKRFFVATEEADNFVVYYFERERDAATPLKAKGAIHPCGYRVRPSTAAEDARDCRDKDAGPLGLVLEPLDRKRTWVLRFDSDEARQRWREVLEYAALHCEAPLAKDPVLNDAFKDAYARSRRALGLSGYYRLDRPEREQLCLLAAQAVEANVLAPLYSAGAAAAAATAAGAGAPAGAAASAELERLRAAAEKELDALVAAIVGGAWAAILARVELRRDAVEDVAESSLNEILREEKARLAEVRASTERLVKPLAREAAAPVVGVVLGALLKPLYKAHKQAITIFWHRICDIVERGLKETELRQFYRDTRFQAQSLRPAFRKVRTLTRGEAGDEADAGEAALKLMSELTVPVPELLALMGGVTLYEVEVIFERSLRLLLTWGIYSFVAEVESVKGGQSPIECLHGVMRHMIHDSKLRQRSALAAVFRDVLTPTVRARALALPAVAEIAAGSVLRAARPPFVVVPPPPAAPAAPAAGEAPPPPPAATPVPKGKKAVAAAHAEVRASSHAALFLDADWLLDDVVGEAVSAAQAAAAEERTAAMLARLDKLPGKLGFSSA